MAAQYGTQNIEYGDPHAEEIGFSSGAAPFQKRPRKRLNVVPIILGLILPWVMFSVVFSVLATDFHQRQPVLSVVIAGIGFLICAGTGSLALKSKMGKINTEPNWFMFLFLTMSIAWLLAVILGDLNFKMVSVPHKGLTSLGTYAGVDPSRNRGQQMMDAGIMNFVQGARLDIGVSMAFRNRDFYCVAPITVGDRRLATYDFWVVGKNCCNEDSSKFHCTGFNLRNPVAMRLMDDKDQGFYRLAVQQAEAAHHINAIHPLFFTLGEEPAKALVNMQARTTRNVMMGLFGFFILQSFLVAIAALIFSKVV